MATWDEVRRSALALPETGELDEIVRDAWLARAPTRLVKQYLAEN